MTKLHFMIIRKDRLAAVKHWLQRAFPGVFRVGEDRIAEDPLLSDEQMAIYRALESSESHAFITGKAGTGKSVVLRYFASHTKKVVVKVAPTGISALAVQGQTIHSLFRLSTGVLDPRSIQVSSETEEILRHVDVIVIDEISMVRADTIDAIDRILRISKANQLPFGGTQMVMFGDVYQLPPVAVGLRLQNYFRAKYGGAYFFNAHVWKKTELTTYELQTVFRQADESFRDLLNEVRNGSYTKKTLTTLNSRVAALSDTPTDTIILTSTNKAAQEINEERLSRLRGKTKSYSAVTTGNVPIGTLPTEKKLKLRIGAQVVFIKNDPDKNWVNGTMGVVKVLKKDYIRVACGKAVYDVVPVTWEQSAYSYDEELEVMRQEVTGTFTQLPIKLAWAITIHKSQGCSYDKVVIDLRRGAFAHGQAYVALSRCRSLAGLYLLGRIKPQDILIDPTVTKFMAQNNP